MRNRKSLPSDIARCDGINYEQLCQSCARRIQNEHDSKTAWFPYMEAAPINGRCVYRIEEKDNA